MKPSLTIFCILILAAATFPVEGALAQEEVRPSRNSTTSSVARPTGSITGKVTLPSGHPLNQRVRITISSITTPSSVLYTDNSGGFGFRGLAEGNYTIEVIPDIKEYEVVTQEVRLIRGMQVRLMISLREKTTETRKPSNVATAETDQDVPAAAKKEFERGSKLAAEGRAEEAIARFKQALAIFPNYLMARNDLGVQFLNLNRFDEAAEQFLTALEISPTAFNPNLNLGIVLVKKRIFAEALERLRKTLSLNSSSPSAHLYVGIALLETEEAQQAEQELTTALSLGGVEFAVAHFFLGRAYLRLGNRESAVRELNNYLRALPTGEYAAAARNLLGRLEGSG